MKIIEPEVFNEELKDLRKYMQSKGYSPNEEILLLVRYADFVRFEHNSQVEL